MNPGVWLKKDGVACERSTFEGNIAGIVFRLMKWR